MGQRIVLADDHRILRDGLRVLLETQLGHTVVGEAENGRMALSLVGKLKPDLVIMDLSMPDMNGIEATHRIREDFPKVKIICLSMHADKRFVADMLSAGASAYLLKDCASEDLQQAINAVSSGASYVSPGLHNTLVNDYVHKLQGKYDKVDLALTPRERDVLLLLAEGLSTKEIAAQLALSVKTIETHRSHLMEKLGVDNVPGLVKYAIREGLTNVDS